MLGKRVYDEKVGKGNSVLERKQDEPGGALTCRACGPFRNLNLIL